jgi:4-hydroxy-tetrahydrodipicolinate reductase
MGKAIAGAVEAASDLELAGTWKRGDDLDPLVESADVVIDFSLPGATGTVLESVQRLSTPLVCGVTGLAAEQLQALEQAGSSIPIVYDRNMSPGIAVLERIAADAAAALGSEFSVAIHETHHVHKVDAPSGTALKLGEAVARARGEDPAGIHYESERRGEVPGDHRVILASATERLVLEHSVSTRDVFAAGAIRAARWLAGRAPGLYSMQDVLARNG